MSIESGRTNFATFCHNPQQNYYSSTGEEGVVLGVRNPNSTIHEQEGKAGVRSSDKSRKPETSCNKNEREENYEKSTIRMNTDLSDKINDGEDSNDGNKTTNLQVRELQERLEKRNTLLDIVRKAYHRDVLAVKECILQQEQQKLQHHKHTICESNVDIEINETSTTKANDNPILSHHKSASSSLISLLSSVPSIDLRRHEGLHLFSPQECELRLHPCFECGGHFEVIHRESSRYESLLRYRDRLLKKLHDLELEV